MSIPLLNEKLNTETARISWEELQPHFARGAAVYVAPDLDLIAVARHVAEDEAAPLKQWMEQGKFGAVSDDMARTFGNVGGRCSTVGIGTALQRLIRPSEKTKPEHFACSGFSFFRRPIAT